MSAAIKDAPTVRIFAPDGNGGYIQWGDLPDAFQKQVRERICGDVRRAWGLRHSAVTADEHKAEVSKQVRELIGWLTEAT